MPTFLRVRWTLLPERPPEPWLPCPGCGTLRPFRSSGRIRLNANGRRLDAWLIYRCAVCERSWNRPVIERRAVRDLPPATLAALEASAPAAVRAVAFDLAGLRAHSRRVESFGAGLRAERLGGPAGWTALAIEIAVPEPVGLRLDRLLAARFGLSRAGVEALAQAGRLRVEGGALHRPVAGGCRVVLVPEPAERGRWAAAALSARPRPEGGGSA